MKTILLVDDNLAFLYNMGEVLSMFGYKVIPKPDAESALSIIQEGITVDLVVTDYRMPGMDGHEFLYALKKVLPSVPVIMLTGHGSVETYLKSLSLGVFEHLNKPVEIKEVRRIVEAALAWSDAGHPLSVS
jgi:two-component system nitrogen regulation response regulator NtrX